MQEVCLTALPLKKSISSETVRWMCCFFQIMAGSEEVCLYGFENLRKKWKKSSYISVYVGKELPSLKSSMVNKEKAQIFKREKEIAGF